MTKQKKLIALAVAVIAAFAAYFGVDWKAIIDGPQGPTTQASE